jgi:segregation and condensation protein B
MENNSSQLVQKLEAVLFYLAEPVKLSFLLKSLDVKKEDLDNAINELKEVLKERGLRLVENDSEIVLATAPEFSSLIEKIIKEERERDLGRAGIETLAIIAYKGPVTKKEIEYIRGVNSQYALRNLLLRGLVERKASQKDERMIVYTLTGDAVRHLGLTNISDLPEYKNIRGELEVEKEAIENSETDEEYGD